ncbi:hypothetical protein B0H11DRAFT_271633 [Mycena galericulata]|nr:hypothetical protein B0H11DRAFT_271633 [Mycena galericulata]
MSTEELEARIEKISADIEVQREVLKTLERTKSLYQHQLNAVRDPLARLPLELSSKIFLLCLHPLPEPRAHHIPMLLLNICTAWTDVALSTPALWADIRLVFPRAKGFRQLLGIWLQRGLNLPSSISLTGLTKTFDEGVAPIVWERGQHLKHLALHHDRDNFDIDLLGCSSPGPLPLLETLAIRQAGASGSSSYRGPQILELLRLAPNLVECTFAMPSVHGLDVIQERLVLPALRQLKFEELARDRPSDDCILKYLTIPCLETLSLSTWDVIFFDDLLAFVKRSSPPLQELVLGPGSGQQLVECLHLLPTLTHLDIWWPRTGGEEELFFTVRLLPNLRSWTIRLRRDELIFDTAWEALLHTLTARRTQIQNVHIMFRNTSPHTKPPAHILAGFTQEVNDLWIVQFDDWIRLIPDPRGNTATSLSEKALYSFHQLLDAFWLPCVLNEKIYSLRLL